MEGLIKDFISIEPLGYGSGSGYGDGSGDGYGSGYGSGYGYGDGYKVNNPFFNQSKIKEYRKGFIDKEIATFKTFKGKEVYYIDNIPCCFLAIKDNVAKVDIIKEDFTTEVQYIAKRGNLFAHGYTKQEAVQSAIDKHFASLSFQEKKIEFISKFKKNDVNKNKVYFEWHHILTGSCKSGRLNFIQSRGINLYDEMTVVEFLTITQNEYNGNIIKEILSEIQ